MNVATILQAKGDVVFSVQSDGMIAEAIDVLNRENIGALVVLDSTGKLVGILSERDVVRRLGRDGAGAVDLRVADCMTANPYVCSPDSSIEDLMAVMTQKRIRHLPVVNGGALVGVVSIGDVVKRKIEIAEQEAAALKEYISS